MEDLSSLEDLDLGTPAEYLCKPYQDFLLVMILTDPAKSWYEGTPGLNVLRESVMYIPLHFMPYEISCGYPEILYG